MKEQMKRHEEKLKINGPRLVAFCDVCRRFINPSQQLDVPRVSLGECGSLHIVLTTVRLDGPSRVAGCRGYPPLGNAGAICMLVSISQVLLVK